MKINNINNHTSSRLFRKQQAASKPDSVLQAAEESRDPGALQTLNASPDVVTQNPPALLNPPETPGSEADKTTVPQSYRMPPRKWFFTFMCMNIPIAGWIYLLAKAFSKKDNQLKDFSRAYLLYKLVFLIVSLVIIGLLIYVGLEIADKVLAYMEML